MREKCSFIIFIVGRFTFSTRANEITEAKELRQNAFTCLFHSSRVMKCSCSECARARTSLRTQYSCQIPVSQLACAIVHCARQKKFVSFHSNHTNWLTDYFRVLKITRTHLSRRKSRARKKCAHFFFRAAHKIKLLHELHSTIVLLLQLLCSRSCLIFVDCIFHRSTHAILTRHWLRWSGRHEWTASCWRSLWRNYDFGSKMANAILIWRSHDFRCGSRDWWR